ncbi:MAG: hypothetical protein H6807_00730 [Planctomycetes bacterium]|nr:hypothetical protein [Planctomycetota bacterium]
MTVTPFEVTTVEVGFRPGRVVEFRPAVAGAPSARWALLVYDEVGGICTEFAERQSFGGELVREEQAPEGRLYLVLSDGTGRGRAKTLCAGPVRGRVGPDDWQPGGLDVHIVLDPTEDAPVADRFELRMEGSVVAYDVAAKDGGALARGLPPGLYSSYARDRDGEMIGMTTTAIRSGDLNSTCRISPRRRHHAR